MEFAIALLASAASSCSSSDWARSAAPVCGKRLARLSPEVSAAPQPSDR
jgi:hypothetical protein